MTVFANVFLLLFIADGSVSILDELVTLFAPFPALAVLRHVLADAVIYSSIPLYLCLGLDRRLPKRVFLPLVLFAWVAPIAAWLFPPLADMRGFGLFAGVAQVLLFLLATLPFQKGREKSPLMPDTWLRGPFFAWKNTLSFAAVNLFVLPCLLAAMLAATADAYMQKYTSGFVRLGPDGVHMTEKVYRKGDKTVRLAGMIHVGERQYYEKVIKPQPGRRTIVLAEGVTDDRRLLHNRVDYGQVATYLGLSSQQDNMLFKGRMIDEAELDKPGRTSSRAAKETEPDILRADVDVSSFRPSTVWFLDEVGKQMKGGAPVGKQILTSIAWSQKNITPEMQQVITDDILYRRNKELIRNLEKALEHYDVVVVPWGALHMAEIEADVQKQGFRLAQVNDMVAIHFTKKTNR